jgi:hypothetical protein
MFAGLPREIQEVVSAREADREKTLRRGQNEIAEMKKRLQADAEKAAATTEGNTDAKETGIREGRGAVLEERRDNDAQA